MHICFDGIVFSLQSSGGVSICFEHIITGLVRQRQQVTLWAFPGCDASRSWPLLQSLLPDYPNFQIVRSGGRGRLERLLAFREPLPAGSIFHSSYYRLPRAGVRSRVPTVTTVHDFTHERRASPLRRWLLARQKRQAILHSDAVVCVSSRTAADVARYVPQVDLAKVHIVPNGASTAYRPLMDSAENAARLARLGVRPPFALFVGRRVRHKNFGAAAAAVAAIPQLQFVVVGGGELKTPHRQALSSLPQDRWIAHTWLTEDDLNFLYNRALALVYPSSDEGFGIPIVEAAAAGCPAITIQGAVPNEVNADPELALAEPQPEAISAVLRRLMDPDFRAQIRQRALNAGAAASWDGTVKKLMAVYESLAESSR